MTTATAWARALERFEGGYGDGPPDFDDATDRSAFLALLEDEVRDGITQAIVTIFKAETLELRAELDGTEQ